MAHERSRARAKNSSFELIQASLQVIVLLIFLIGLCHRLATLDLSLPHHVLVIVDIDSDLFANVLVDAVSLFFLITLVHGGVHRISHHFLLHFHLSRFFSELLQALTDRLDVHFGVHLAHHLVYTLEGIDHACIDLCSREPHRNSLQLGGHHIVLRYLISHSN